VNSLETVVQYGSVSRTVSLQGRPRAHSLGVPSERQPVRSEEIFQGRDYSLAVPVRFVSIIIVTGLRFTP